jgi:SulP family sulfate permease
MAMAEPEFASGRRHGVAPRAGCRFATAEYGRREFMYVPQSVSCLRSYSRKQFLSDVTAGLVVGVVALPLAMAFAIASGLTPERGLYTAIIAGFLISALGGSRVQIGGPTGAFVVLVYDIVQRHGVDGLMVSTILAGCMLVLLGFARLGVIIKYIPYPVITGFTSGIAVIIFTTQIKDLLGLTTGPLPGDFLGKWAELLNNLATINWTAVGLSALCIGIIAYWPKSWRRIPGPVVAMIVATSLVQILGLQVETIGSRFGGIPSTLPPIHVPAVSLSHIAGLISPAATLALLAAIESLLSAVVADGMTGYRHKSNIELVAQGVANIVSPLFGGFTATGAIARTATNIRNGASTPVAGIVHALTLLVIMLAFGRWARLVPMCCLASVLVVVAYHMSEWRAFRCLLRTPRSDVAVLLTTFAITVIFDLTLAVQIGVVLAAFLFMKRMADVTRIDTVSLANVDAESDGREQTEEGPAGHPVPAGVQVYEFNGPFFFGAAEKVRDVFKIVEGRAKVLILRMRHVPAIDATGLHTLEEVAKNCARSGTALVLCGVQRQPLQALRRSHQLDIIGRANITDELDEALLRADEIIEEQGHSLQLHQKPAA